MSSGRMAQVVRSISAAQLRNVSDGAGPIDARRVPANGQVVVALGLVDDLQRGLGGEEELIGSARRNRLRGRACIALTPDEPTTRKEPGVTPWSTVIRRTLPTAAFARSQERSGCAWAATDATRARATSMALEESMRADAAARRCAWESR